MDRKEPARIGTMALQYRRPAAAALLALLFVFGYSASAAAETFSLDQTIQTALEENLDLKIAREETQAAEYTRKARLTEFFPTFSASYEYTYHDEERRSLGFLTRPQDENTTAATISQPLFTGLAITNQYKIAELGSDVAQHRQQTARRDIVFAARNAYFSILKAEKIVVVAEQAVEQLTANHKVARDFYQVGMIPYNDLLKAEVELANARQDLIVAVNRLKIAQTDFNKLLRRPINAPVALVDTQEYSTLELDLETCLETAKKERKELVVGDLQVEIATREVEISRSSYFPTITLEGTYFRNETGYAVGSGDPVGFIDDPDGWDISAMATWELFKWGKTNSSVREKLSRLSQAEYRRSQIGDAIEQEVKEAYLRTQDSESNIRAVEKAVEQAKENFRITEQRYTEQMATTTDVLDAQTLLSRTLTNYYNALYDFKISKASLYRAMGLEKMP